MNFQEISIVVLWVLQIVTALAVIGLARQVGLLHLRVHPVGPGTVEKGPPIGSRVTVSPVVSFRSELLPVIHPDRLSLVMFVMNRSRFFGHVVDLAHHAAAAPIAAR